jgi:hypothetical protein
MNAKKLLTSILFTLFIALNSDGMAPAGDSTDVYKNEVGRLSLGVRNTISLFDHTNTGLGSGGQFMVQLSPEINTNWFADYIAINVDDVAKSVYWHIGWSGMFQPFRNTSRNVLPRLQPYVLAGHCFDYNYVVLNGPGHVSKDRWGSAVQAGIGTHYNLTNRFFLSLIAQYMVHLTSSLEVKKENNQATIHSEKHSTMQGHLLLTVSLNYKIANIWRIK